MILYLTGLNAVDPEQVEAARLDGAKGWRMLWYVIMPQLKPATFIAFVVTIIGALRSFDLISIMTNGGPFGSTRVLSFYMFEESLSEFGFRMGYGAAIAVVLFFIMLGLHRLLPLVDVAGRERGALMAMLQDPPRARSQEAPEATPIAKRSSSAQLSYQAFLPVGADPVALPLIAVAIFSIKPGKPISSRQLLGHAGLVRVVHQLRAWCSFEIPTCRATC